jgi:acyl-[acyl carrier protein]--UDP-N-acetylglucosamine O-acyltransferase
LRRAYQSLFFADGPFADRVEATAREFADDPAIGKIIAFIRAGGRRRLIHPRVKEGSGGRGDSAA